MVIPAESSVKVANNALYLIGAEPLTAFTDDSAQANVAEAIYEDTIRAALETHRWRFAAMQEDLVRLTSAPAHRFDAAYAYPDDFVHMIGVFINDNPIEYDRYDSMIYCNAASTDTVTADFIYRADEADWPSSFRIGVQFRLAETFAMTLARDGAMSKLMETRGDVAMARARRIDSQQQTTKKLNTSRFITQRRS